MLSAALRVYFRVLQAVMTALLAVMVVPVTLQIVSRYTGLIPRYIWTEEVARFCFIWIIMVGAMVAVREGTHFEVDVLPAVLRELRKGRLLDLREVDEPADSRPRGGDRGADAESGVDLDVLDRDDQPRGAGGLEVDGGIGVDEFHDALRKKCGAHQQQSRDGHLADDEVRPRPAER